MTEPFGAIGPVASSPRAPLLTFLIADVRGYTRFTTEHGDEAAARLAGAFARIAKEEAAAQGGEVIELRGDEALAVFSSARNALRTAVALQERFTRQMADEPSLPLTVGIGLDAGEAIPVEGGYRGGALNLAARLCSIAGGGEVFSSETVIGLARKTDGIAFVDRGEVALKGLTTPVRVIQIAPEGTLPDALPPLQPILVTHPTNLPGEPTPFIGREDEIVQVAGLLRDPHVRMVTLTGPGGTGKTRLALQVGNTLLYDFRDGVFFVNLAPLTDPALVPSSIAGVLGVQEEAGTDLLTRLVDAVQDKHLLLVLDNLEHLLDATAIIASLLEQCRDLHVLVTSRVPVHLSWEHVHAVPPLSIPDPHHLPDLASLTQFEAVALFIDRARAARDTFTVTNENATAVAEICSRLDGLPLAIELAAARITLFPPAALLQRLDRRLKVLTGGAKDRPTRQQTLRGAIDWSYSLLTPEEQTLFARLSVFAGGCTFEAAEAVANPGGELDLLDGLASLVDKSLLREVGEEEPRFVMLETIREYAREKLDGRGEADATHRAHMAYVLQMAQAAEPELSGPNQGEWLARLAMELDNVRIALRWSLDAGEVSNALRLAAALFYLWLFRGYWSEGRRWLEEGLERAEGADRMVRGWALTRLGGLMLQQNDLERATHVLREALELFRATHDRAGSGRALNALGIIANNRGQYDQAAAFFEESLGHLRDIGDRPGAARALGNLGMIALDQGRHDDAIERFDEAQIIFHELGDVHNIALTLLNLGVAALEGEDSSRAETWLEEALAMFRDLDARPSIALCLQNLASLAIDEGHLERARHLLRDGLVLARDLGPSRLLFGLITVAVSEAFAEGRMEQTVRIAGAEATLRMSYGQPRQLVNQGNLDEQLVAARAALGEDGFNRAWEQGQAMSLEKAIACALEETA